MALGLFSGFTSGLLGIGGGLLMTTYMSLFSDMSQLTAVATSLAAIAPIGNAPHALPPSTPLILLC